MKIKLVNPEQIQEITSFFPDNPVIDKLATLSFLMDKAEVSENGRHVMVRKESFKAVLDFLKSVKDDQPQKGVKSIECMGFTVHENTDIPDFSFDL